MPSAGGRSTTAHRPSVPGPRPGATSRRSRCRPGPAARRGCAPCSRRARRCRPGPGSARARRRHGHRELRRRRDAAAGCSGRPAFPAAEHLLAAGCGRRQSRDSASPAGGAVAAAAGVRTPTRAARGERAEQAGRDGAGRGSRRCSPSADVVIGRDEQHRVRLGRSPVAVRPAARSKSRQASPVRSSRNSSSRRQLPVVADVHHADPVVTVEPGAGDEVVRVREPASRRSSRGSSRRRRA